MSRRRSGGSANGLRPCGPITQWSAPPPLAGKTVATHTLSIPRATTDGVSDARQALRSAWLVSSLADHTGRSRPRGIVAPVFRLRRAAASSKAPSTECWDRTDRPRQRAIAGGGTSGPRRDAASGQRQFEK